MSGGITLGTKGGPENLREAVKNRRGRLRLSAPQAAALGGVPEGTWSAIEQGKSANPKPQTLGGVDQAMRWGPMIAYRVLVGDMTPAEAVALPILPMSPSDEVADIGPEPVMDELVETMARLGPSQRRSVLRFAEALAEAS